MSSTSLLLVVCVVSLTVIYGEATTCGKGEYYVQSSDSCLRCPENSFMDTENHTRRSCFACSNISDDENALETGECSPEQNKPITKCKQGFYPLKRGRDFVCQGCTTDDCPVKNNSLCCVFSDPKTPAPSGTNGTVSNGTNGTIINGTTLTVIYGEATTCGKGEYYVQSSDSCLRCPENSFMDTENHTWRSCFACSNISDDENALETGECSPEQNKPITKCKQGFYPLKRGRDFVCQGCTTDDCPVKNNSLCCVFSDPKTPVGNDSNGEVKIALIVICTFLGLLLAGRIAGDLYHFKIRRYLRYSRAKSADANIENTP